MKPAESIHGGILEQRILWFIPSASVLWGIYLLSVTVAHLAPLLSQHKPKLEGNHCLWGSLNVKRVPVFAKMQERLMLCSRFAEFHRWNCCTEVWASSGRQPCLSLHWVGLNTADRERASLLLTEVWPSGRELSEPDAEGDREIKKPQCMCEGLAVTSQKASGSTCRQGSVSSCAVHETLSTGRIGWFSLFFPHSSHILTGATLNALAFASVSKVWVAQIHRQFTCKGLRKVLF